jgi:hypothetical protein
MEDQHLKRLLRELPREQARQGFTRRVLARLDSAPAPRAGWRWPQRQLAAAVTVAVVLTGGAAGMAHYQRVEAQRAARQARAQQLLRELRAEHGQIKRELEALPQPPVVYLGGNEDMDLVVDLRRVREVDGVRPATYSHTATEIF